MKVALLSWMQCPVCQEPYRLLVSREGTEEIREGSLGCRCVSPIPIRSGIPRFVGSDGYTRSFSFEWQRHARTQLDSANRSRRSEEQFQARLDIPLSWLKGKLVLDAGCGVGRFAEVAAKHGATVIGVDMSFAIDAARDNLRDWPTVHLLQADLASLPFPPETFDLIYSFGVLHHTPDAKQSFEALILLLKPGGRIALFVYSAYNKGIVYSSSVWRAMAARLPRRLLYRLCVVAIPLYYLYRVPVIGHVGKLLFPISMEPNWRWRWLDTFDWYAPTHQSKHTHAEVFRWFRDAGLHNLFIGEGEVTMVGLKSNAHEAVVTAL